VSRHPAPTCIANLGELAPIDHGYDRLAVDPQDRGDLGDGQRCDLRSQQIDGVCSLDVGIHNAEFSHERLPGSEDRDDAPGTSQLTSLVGVAWERSSCWEVGLAATTYQPRSHLGQLTAGRP
jgi:hypothetical protein